MKRLLRHLLCSPRRVRRAFGPTAMQAVAQAIAAGERGTSGEVRLAVEGALEPLAVWRGLSPRARALEVFAQLRVWDTAHNNGVLIYVLLADRAVEIVADRGLAQVPVDVWQQVCRGIEAAFVDGRFQAGAEHGIGAVVQVLRAHWPSRTDGQSNELPDEPVVL